MNPVYEIITNRQLTYRQKITQLAMAAENSLNILELDNEIRLYMEKSIICDLFEGQAPYRPRYILPDYARFLTQGSAFLNLKPPSDLYEALNHLLILYRHVPSVTTFPVFLGNLDTLLDPFIEDEVQAFKLIRLFLTHIDRTLPDSFVHANIGPEPTRAGRLILKAEAELTQAVPNLTLKYQESTPDDFAIEAIQTGLKSSKPYFANHPLFVEDFGDQYGIASCYNGLPIGGGSHTLVRMNLKHLALQASNIDDFLENVLPHAVSAMCRLMDQRIAFLVEKSGFFETNFLVAEQLIKKERFLAMFGILGMAECVNHLNRARNLSEKFGHNPAATEHGVRILTKLESLVNSHINPHCPFFDGRFALHAQSGIGSDLDTSPGCRIPIGEEPDILNQIIHASHYHKFFPTGISDIFVFDETAERNPLSVLDIIKGAMKAGLRLFAFYKSDNDLIRISGYLVKRSEMQKNKSGKQNLNSSVALGIPSAQSLHIENRKIASLSHNSSNSNPKTGENL